MAGFKPNTSTIPVQESRHTAYIDESIQSKHVGHACSVVVGGTDLVVKLAEAGDVVFGQISTVEIPKNPNDRAVAMITVLGGYRLACAPDAGFKIGDTVVGGAGGLVVPGAAASTDFRFFVAETDALADGAVGVLKL